MTDNVFIKILIMCLTLYSIRVLPFIFLRKKIKNRYIKSFFYYVPYVTLAVMTFPAIINSTDNKISGFLAFIVGLLTAWSGGNLFVVSTCCCLAVLITSVIL